jgi:hypothetical protein
VIKLRPLPGALLVIVTLVGASPSVDGLHRLAAAKPDVKWESATALSADFDCDGRADQAFLGRSGGRVFVGVVGTARSQPAILDFAVGGGMQPAICAEPAVLSIESLDYDPGEAVGEIDGFHRSKACKGLQLEGGQCDSLHLYWNHNTKRLEWWRA